MRKQMVQSENQHKVARSCLELCYQILNLFVYQEQWFFCPQKVTQTSQTQPRQLRWLLLRCYSLFQFGGIQGPRDGEACLRCPLNLYTSYTCDSEFDQGNCNFSIVCKPNHCLGTGIHLVQILLQKSLLESACLNQQSQAELGLFLEHGHLRSQLEQLSLSSEERQVQAFLQLKHSCTLPSFQLLYELGAHSDSLEIHLSQAFS